LVLTFTKNTFFFVFLKTDKIKRKQIADPKNQNKNAIEELLTNFNNYYVKIVKSDSYELKTVTHNKNKHRCVYGDVVTN
jgi:hypothetical protein